LTIRSARWRANCGAPAGTPRTRRQAFPGTISRAAAVGAPGLMVMAIILLMGKVSGAAKGDLYTEIEHPVRPEAVCGPSPVADVWAAYVPSFTPDHRRRE
jgi:hypothetical protein